MKNILPTLPLFIVAASAPALATDYTWTSTSAAGAPTWSWSDTTKWNPASVPGAGDNVIFSTTGGSPTITFNSAYSLANLAVTGQGGTTTSYVSADVAGTYSLSISGAVSKNNGSSNVAFHDINGGRLFNLSVGTLNFTNTGGGSYFFGRSDGARRLNSLSIGAFNMGAADTSTSTVQFNVTGAYSLGLATFSGTNTKTLNLINNASGSAGYAQTATVKGLVQTSGTAATIRGSNRASTTANEATLRIDVDEGASYSASTVLVDGVGGTLAVRKTGLGSQTLTGAHTFTGGLSVEAGRLTVDGSLAAAGDITVFNGATFDIAADLSANDVSLQAGSVLRFDLGEGTSLNISGNLTKSGAGNFVVDFGNTGALDTLYGGLFSISGTMVNDFAGQNISYVNFGAGGLSGQLSFEQLAGGFTITAVPEPSSASLLAGAAALGLFTLRRRRRA